MLGKRTITTFTGVHGLLPFSCMGENDTATESHGHEQGKLAAQHHQYLCFIAKWAKGRNKI